jgi:hypothetical protein
MIGVLKPRLRFCLYFEVRVLLTGLRLHAYLAKIRINLLSLLIFLIQPLPHSLFEGFLRSISLIEIYFV